MLIKNHSDFQAALTFINNNDVLALDIETDGLNQRSNRIIGIGISNATDGIYLPTFVWTGTLLDASSVFSYAKPLLSSLVGKKLLTWNGGFDIPFIKNFFGIDLLPYLHADVMLMKHTCDEEFPFGLKEVATKLWGLDAKIEKEEMLESIKANGGGPKDYYKASTETLSKYCIKDALLTFRAYTHYSKELQRQGLEVFYYTDEVMPLYKHVTIPMEQRGVALNIDSLKTEQAAITKDIQAIEASIQAQIAPYLPDVFVPWLLNKDYPMQTYTGKVPVWRKKHATQKDAWSVDNPGAYMFNLQSKHHLKKLFFDTLGEEPLSRTPTGQPQVDETFLDSVALKYEWAQQLIVYNKLNKLKSTYIDRFLQEQENGIFYPSFMQHRTVSGRFGSDLQQLPRPLEPNGENDLVSHYTSIIRTFVVCRDNCNLISADYEQLEPSVFSHNSSDPNLIAIFNNGLDFYSEVAIRTEGLTDVSSDKRAPNYLGAINKAKRQKAKSYSLGIAYGMSGYKLKFEVQSTQEEADKLVADYYAAFPKLKETMDALQNSAKKNGYVVSAGGRIRRMPLVQKLYQRHGDCIDNDLELWKKYHNIPALYAKAKEDRKTYKNLMNNALNFPIQSLAASIVNRACINIAKKLKTEKLDAHIIMQIHDEIVVEASQKDTERACQILKQEMETVVKLKVPLRAEPIVGKNFKECK